MTDRRPADFATHAVQGPAREHDHPPSHAPPIYQTTAFTFANAHDAIAAFQGSGAFTYSRKGNPTVRALERHIALLETHPVPGAPVIVDPAAVETRFFASGMAAISTTMLAIARGGRAVCQQGIYGTTERFAREMDRFGVEVGFVPAADLAALGVAAATGAPPALLFVETPANPVLQTTDIAAAAEIAHGVGAALVVDATFATPALMRPLAWGADLVVHSTTKFMSGFGVVLGGCVTGAASVVGGDIDSLRVHLGGVADPMKAWLTQLGLKTLDVRMHRHSTSAARLAAALAEHPAVDSVRTAEPADLPAGQLAATAPMVSFEVAGGEEDALAVIDALEIATLTPTLGTLDTVVQHPYTMSHVVLPPARRREMGIEPGIVRVSVGIEDPADLVADFTRSLDRVAPGS